MTHLVRSALLPLRPSVAGTTGPKWQRGRQERPLPVVALGQEPARQFWTEPPDCSGRLLGRQRVLQGTGTPRVTTSWPPLSPHLRPGLPAGRRGEAVSATARLSSRALRPRACVPGPFQTNPSMLPTPTGWQGAWGLREATCGGPGSLGDGVRAARQPAPPAPCYVSQESSSVFKPLYISGSVYYRTSMTLIQSLLNGSNTSLLYLHINFIHQRNVLLSQGSLNFQN